MDWLQLTSPYFTAAVEQGLPIFLGHEKDSTPLNASPYVCDIARFLILAAEWPGRRTLVHKLNVCFGKAQQAGISVEAILIGGSFTDLCNPAPHDLDSLWLYRAQEQDDGLGERLRSLQHQFKDDRIDARFIPVDAGAAVLVKAISFFTVLYSKLKGKMSLERGLILLDCSDLGKSDHLPTRYAAMSP